VDQHDRVVAVVLARQERRDLQSVDLPLQALDAGTHLPCAVGILVLARERVEHLEVVEVGRELFDRLDVALDP
jgi:hypothetical protein